jgi:hypothetical protein
MIPLSCKEPPCPRCQALEERLSQAGGALSDILVLLTSCVARGDDAVKLESIISATHRRILESADRPRTRPSWDRHIWEKRNWDEFDNSRIHACGTDRPVKDVAMELMDASKDDGE